eukprot:1266712-Prymnesium_polylepis.1
MAIAWQSHGNRTALVARGLGEGQAHLLEGPLGTSTNMANASEYGKCLLIWQVSPNMARLSSYVS